MSKYFRNQTAQSRLLVFLLLFTLLLAACGGGAKTTEAPASDTNADAAPAEATTAPSGVASFSNDIQPILSANCSGCHFNRSSGGVRMDTYDNLIASNVVTAGDSANSLLYQAVESGRMPQGGQPLSSDQVQKIADWINAGANND